MAMAVVDGLEFVEVEINQRRGRAIAFDVGQ
jgi:tetrahydromethanopterin S-methyltransferase subunit G